jgi:alkylated DNA nucleotide flippase Atl1
MVVAKQSRAHVRKHEMSILVPVAPFKSVGRALAGKDGSNTFPGFGDIIRVGDVAEGELLQLLNREPKHVGQCLIDIEQSSIAPGQRVVRWQRVRRYRGKRTSLSRIASSARLRSVMSLNVTTNLFGRKVA